MKKCLVVTSVIICSLMVSGQDKQKIFTPYVAVYAGGCVDNPFQFNAGIQKPLQKHLTIAYDIHYWKTGYECYCDDMHTKGDYRSITPSVKVIYNTGKKEGRGLMAGLGLGYMFAKDRGSEQTYVYDELSKSYLYGNMNPGNWDFNSIAPSFSLGVGFRMFKLPASFNAVNYFARSTEGWIPAAGGFGLKVGIRKIE